MGDYSLTLGRGQGLFHIGRNRIGVRVHGVAVLSLGKPLAQ
jgi:hypothetical protein